ncbi:MAG TPA: hypothetical protein VMU16_03145 [Candidatus Binataceae bacterium]|nr:hypothetical protein [Candidatus Binataceae bacterium]
MGFFRNLFRKQEHSPATNGHELIIGPLCDNALFSSKARLYFCIQCKQRFLVCGNRYALMDRRGNVLATIASQDNAESLEQSVCPARDMKQPKPPVKAFIVHLRPSGKSAAAGDRPVPRRVNARF